MPKRLEQTEELWRGQLKGKARSPVVVSAEENRAPQ